MFRCPVCGLETLVAAPYSVWPPPPGVDLRPPYEDQLGAPSYEECAVCHFEFGADDNPGTTAGQSFDEFRRAWLAQRQLETAALEERLG